MNFVAFVLVLAAGIIAAILVFQNWKENLLAWAVLCLSIGVIIQEVFITWSHSIKN
jgi:hypothetical protein